MPEVLRLTVDISLRRVRSLQQISPHLTSSQLHDLISDELSGCKASQFAVAATNQNWLIGERLSSPRYLSGFIVGLHVASCAIYCVQIATTAN